MTRAIVVLGTIGCCDGLGPVAVMLASRDMGHGGHAGTSASDRQSEVPDSWRQRHRWQPFLGTARNNRPERRSAAMAIKYGRPIEVRVPPVEARAEAARLDLT